MSEPTNIASIMGEIAKVNPAGLIELGIGGGKYGVLAREVLDWVNGDVSPDTWKHFLVGVEGFERYRNPAWECFDRVIIGDYRAYYPKVTGWNLVLMIDSLEHSEKIEAQIILEHLVQNNSRVIVSVPLGVCPQAGVFGNPLEEHKSSWHARDFEKYLKVEGSRMLHSGVCLVVSLKGKG